MQSDIDQENSLSLNEPITESAVSTVLPAVVFRRDIPTPWLKEFTIIFLVFDNTQQNSVRRKKFKSIDC